MADDPSDALTRGDLHDALRFLHAQAHQGQLDLDRIDAILGALIKTLLDSGLLDRARVETLLPDANARLAARAAHEVTVDVGPAIDKYAVSGPADLDCAALLPLCLGRCCRLTFALSFQDLDEGQVRWDYRQPYRIRQRADDGYCVHSDRETRGCAVYAARPATCRRYDCRNDARIWDDFERRIPAPVERIDRLIQLRTQPRPSPAPPDELRMEPEPETEPT
ncbi:MAG TPA: YkgJ family cysteine cluster protein [Kofleriaceae bacterium]|nr:YkgJ family cysteine cluster protein [Kofleriaceae bacterium]